LISVRSEVVRFAALAIATTGLVAGQFLAAPASQAVPVELVQDGSFEQGGDAWTQDDSAFGTPLCTVEDCGDGGGSVGPHTGVTWAWFGGYGDPDTGEELAPQTATLSQDITIPDGVDVALSFWYYDGLVSDPFTATLTVSMDGDVLHTFTEASAAETEYVKYTYDVSAYADGGSHTLSFDYDNEDAAVDDSLNNMSVDDISVQIPDTTAPDTTINSSPAGGVAKSLSVPITFSSNDNPSTFSCQLDSAPAAPCTSPKTVTVTSGQHTFKVTATDAAGNTDTTPASVTFTAYDCATLNAAVSAAQAKAAAADKKVKKAKKALKKAKKARAAAKDAVSQLCVTSDD
jgi:hypothetical protein